MIPAAQDNQQLAIKNRHPRDEYICFDDPSHKYYIMVDGVWKQVEVSATGKLKQYFGGFDATKQLKRMKNTGTFEYRFKEYKAAQLTNTSIQDMCDKIISENKLEKTDDGYTGIIDDDSFSVESSTITEYDLRAMATERLDQEAAKELSKKAKSSTWGKLAAKNPDASEEELTRMFQKEWGNSNVLGTIFHKGIENFFNGIPVDEDLMTTPEWKQFEHYKQSMTGVPYRTEWAIWGMFSDKLFSGTIDFVKVLGVDDDTLLISIVDWKRSKRISYTGAKMCKAPFDDLKDCNYNHYALQLSLYAYIIQKYYTNMTYEGVTYPNVKVVSRELVVCHPNNVRKKDRTFELFGMPFTPPDFVHLYMPDYTKRIEKILDPQDPQDPQEDK